MKFGTSWFRFEFLFTCLHPQIFWKIYTNFAKIDSAIFDCIDEQHKNEYNSRSAGPTLKKLVSIPMFSRFGFVNMQFKFT